ncbi:MAG TPA: hypothetical protein VF008_03830 [Niastella sp.]
MKYLLLTFLSIFFLLSGKAQAKVASYCFGKYGKEGYEHISFWTKDWKRTHVEYSYGSKPKEIRLQFLGKVIVHGKTCMKVQFPNKYILFITPNGSDLQIEDENRKYNKTFTWEYEGPVNGIGTYCTVCAEGKEDAMEIVKKSYLQ